jgi:hypothetical protein
VPQTQIDRADACTLIRAAGDEDGAETEDVLTR